MTTLRLFPHESALPASSTTEVEWRLLDGTRTRGGRATLAQLPKAERIELFLPPARILRAAVTLPAGARKQARKLLPFALDQVLLGEPTEQHLAYAFVDEECRVAAIQRSLLADLLNTLSEVGHRPRASWSADVLAPSDGSVLLWCGNGWARRDGSTAQWFDASTPHHPPPLLAASLGEVPPTTLAIAEEHAGNLDLTAWQGVLGSDLRVLDHDPLSLPIQRDAIDLMQGEFASGPQLDFDWPKLRATAYLAGAALILATITLVGQWWSWRAEEKALKQEMNSAFLAAFPGTPVVDAQLQLQSKLQTGAGTNTATPVSDAALAKLLSLAPRFAAGADIKLVGLNYQDGRISAEYNAKPDQITSLVQSLQSLGKVETTSAADGRVKLTLTPQ
ncbi:type II secretion system protein GspL [Chitinimonas sp. PSY-7]|uniref:type II secretion system protein GspL n=1 Tax=Chitinimonas sp. PSY-7 TaxID=3459088 RepID=UPI00403FF396